MFSKTAADQRDPTGRLPHPLGRWSLAARLTAWYAASSFLLVILATSYLYWAMETSLESEDDALLADKVRAVRAVLQKRPADTASIRREVEDRWRARENETTYVRVTGEHGQILVESPDLDRALPATSFSPPTGEPMRGTDRRSLDGRDFRLLAVREPASPWTIQLAMDRSMEVEILAEYRERLWYVLGVALIVCAVAGYLIAHYGVRPIHDITKTAGHIRSTNLGERIDATGLPAELLTLAATFNSMLDRLEQAFARLSRFSSDIAHELRTPVHSLRGEVEVALSKSRTTDDYREVLASNLEECNRLAHLIDRLLFLARAENPEMQIVKEPCEIGRELAAVAEFYEAAASEAGLCLEISVDKPVKAELDRSMFQRALGNLIANALAHTPAGGRITLSAQTIDGITQLCVTDTGRGIPQTQLAHVFDRFYRVDPARSSHAGGVGLGLSIVKTIVELHGGTVELASEFGRGTCATLSFPGNSTSPSSSVAAVSVPTR
jgi:two-component system, OmpR family, heavy metal sensor histidine kinase CusS